MLIEVMAYGFVDECETFEGTEPLPVLIQLDAIVTAEKVGAHQAGRKEGNSYDLTEMTLSNGKVLCVHETLSELLAKQREATALTIANVSLR